MTTNARAFVLAAILLGASAGLALAGAIIHTSQITVTQTPGIVGNAAARGILEVEVPADAGAGVSCGNMSDATAEWWAIAPGGFHSWGILYRGQYTGETAMGCVSESGSVDIQINEEGAMLAQTPTVSATPTITPTFTLTFTATAANTPTRTRTQTPTHASTATRTATSTATSTSTLTATATATSP